jgi:hypothetical protein
MRVLLLTAIIALGCSNKISGSLEVKGKTFKPTGCNNLARMSLRGVELEDEGYRRVRVVERADGGADVYWMGTSTEKGEKFKDCATLSLKNQNSSVNKVTNVMGSVKLDCHKDDEEITGSVTFENCH